MGAQAGMTVLQVDIGTDRQCWDSINPNAAQTIAEDCSNVM